METYPVTISELRGGKGGIVGAIFRQSLINLGYSPDAHVYDITNAKQLVVDKAALAVIEEVFA